MSTKHTNPTLYGAVVAFVVFLLTGAVPALVYGGYMGLMMSGLLIGPEATLMARVITGGGMVLGFVATMFLYLVLGALLGAGFGLAFPARSKTTPETHTA